MRVEADIFSGRPNPVWTLSAAESGEFGKLLARLGKSALRDPAPDGLGYRGFHVSGLAQYQRVTVWRELVRTDSSEGTVQWSDESRAAETFLMTTAQRHLDGATFTLLSTLVSAP
ncbi:MAG TPA: hypothetical protein VI299_07575 [Polyangiales bacterium]